MQTSGIPILAVILSVGFAVSLVIAVRGEMCGTMVTAAVGDDRNALLSKAFTAFRGACRQKKTGQQPGEVKCK